jgi:NDP-4-keto-2,6-dideoxyhexose 3-C-methyltransferase
MLKPIEHSRCRACGGDTINVFSLGPQYVSQFMKHLNPVGPRVPLTLMRCHGCGLIQLSHTVDRSVLYGDHYWYKSGIQESMVSALKDVVKGALRYCQVTPRDTVIDIGANDGTLLRQYEEFGLPPIRIAYEPAKNLWEECGKAAEVMIPDYFPQPLESPSRPVEGSVKIITSIAMFYDLEDPNAFVHEIRRLLHPEGIWVVQMGDLLSMLETNGFDNIAHEHLEYYSLLSFCKLIERHGLICLDVEHNQVNGGSLRLYIGHRTPDIRLDVTGIAHLHEQSKKEAEAHLHDRNEPYLEFGARVEEGRREFRKFLLSMVLSGETMDLLAASTKGSVLQQYYDIGPKYVRWAIERSPEKVGLHTVTGIPIVSEEQGRAEPAKVLLVGAWTWADALIERERGKWPTGTKMVIPLPTMRVVTL